VPSEHIPDFLKYLAAIAASLTAIFTFVGKARDAAVRGWRWLRNALRIVPAKPVEPPPVPVARPAEESQDGRPVLRSLRPRICFVTESEDGYGFIEGGDSLRAVIATFRMYKPSADPRGTQVIARLSYQTKSDYGIRESLEEVHRINHGMWIDEGFNSTEFTLTDTKELILAVAGEGKCIAIQDNRHSVSKFKEPSVYEFGKGVEEFFVDVTLVDEFYGAIITYTYKIEIKPLKVSEIIRVPLRGY
jgi:hypothetical protein